MIPDEASLGYIILTGVILLSLVVLVETYLLNKVNQRNTIPKLCMKTWTHNEISYNIEYLTQFEEIVIVAFAQSALVEKNHELPTKEFQVTYITTSCKQILESKVKMVFVSVTQILEENSLCLTEIIDMNGNRYRIDESKIHETKLSNGKLCLAFQPKHKPIQINGLFNQKKLSYNLVGHKKGTIKTSFNKFKR